ncbi:MAG: protease modulator HflK [Legionellales bacterium]|nr:protease modulator HflK [Legionellales bacterium]
MPWNEPGKDKDEKDDNDVKQRDPWKRQPNKSSDGLPDLEEALRKFVKKFSGKSSGSRGSSSGGNFSGNFTLSLKPIVAILGVILLVWVLAGIYIVGPAQQAVVLRFGRYLTTEGPGPHWLARFFETKEVLNVKQISTLEYPAEVLTRDTYMVSVKLAVLYRIADPEKYLFNVVDPVGTLKQATAAAVRQVVGRVKLNTVLPVENVPLDVNLTLPDDNETVETAAPEKMEHLAKVDPQKLHDLIRDEIASTLKNSMKAYNTGLIITDVNLQHVKPPQEGNVSEAYDDANSAREDKKRIINQARAYSADVLPKARGEAARIVQLAKADRDKIILNAQGGVAAFNAILPEYEKSPQVTRERLYLSTIESVLNHSSKLLVDTKGSNVLYLPLAQLMQEQNLSSNKNLQTIKLPPEQTAGDIPLRLDQQTAAAQNNPTQMASNNSSNYRRGNSPSGRNQTREIR